MILASFGKMTVATIATTATTTSSSSSSLIAFQTNTITKNIQKKALQQQLLERHHYSASLDRHLFVCDKSSLSSSSSCCPLSSSSSSFSRQRAFFSRGNSLLYMAQSSTTAVDQQDQQQHHHHHHYVGGSTCGGEEKVMIKNEEEKKKDNKAMTFLKKIGKVGGTANKDFCLDIGFDEGSSCRSSLGSTTIAGGNVGLRKSKHAYSVCTDTGIVDDMKEPFPCTSYGSQWIMKYISITDQQQKTSSFAKAKTTTTTFTREMYEGRRSNVLRGIERSSSSSSLTTTPKKRHLQQPVMKDDRDRGYVQMSTSLIRGEEDRFSSHNDDNDEDHIDASKFDGIELDVRSSSTMKNEIFHVQFKRNVRDSLSSSSSSQSSYRASFIINPDQWMSIRIPWCKFLPHNDCDNEVIVGDVSGSENFTGKDLTRVGILVAASNGSHGHDDDDDDEQQNVILAISGFRFYNNDKNNKMKKDSSSDYYNFVGP